MAGQARNTLSDLFEREPLLLGALGVLVGVAVDAQALPATRAEDQLMGQMPRRPGPEGLDLAHTAVQQAPARRPLRR